MAQPTQYHPPPYASPHSTPSPMTPGSNQPFAPPSAKRPQMSPTTPTGQFHQPMHSPPVQNGNHVGYNPYAQGNTNPYPLPTTQHNPSLGQPPVRQAPQPPHPQLSFQQTPQQAPQVAPSTPTGTMGPPQKPEDNKNADPNELADVMHGTGVDLKAEQAMLDLQGRRTTYAHAGQPGFFDPQRNTLQANTPGGRESFYGAGALNQPPVSEQNARDTVEAKDRLFKRRHAERRQYHNNDAFLLQNVVMNKINMTAQKTQTQVDMAGVLRPTPSTTNNVRITGPEGQERNAVLTNEPLISLSSVMGDILTLLSFAARERVRVAVEDSGALARIRRTTSHGIVPPDFQDIAVGQGKTQEATAEPTPVIGAGSPGANPLKRSHSQANDLSTPVSDAGASDEPAAQPTISFEDQLARVFQRRAEEEDRWEQERLAKRARRATANLVQSGSGDPGSRTGSISSTPAPGTPGGPIDAVAPDLSKMSKKEQKKKQEAEAASSLAINTKNAVSMALGGKKLSWMTGSKAGSGGAGSGTSFGKRTSANTPAKKTEKPAANATNHVAPNAQAPAAKGAKNLGGFREDREDGKGIQIRDVVNALKDHNPEKRTLSKAFGRLERP